MTTSNATEVLRRPGEPHQATFLELFFDLAFVVALTQLSQGLIHDLRWSGAFQTLVLLLAVWWIWSLTAGTTDLFDPQRPAVQLEVVYGPGKWLPHPPGSGGQASRGPLH